MSEEVEDREEQDVASLFVESLTIRNFRGLTNVSLTFEPDLTVLVGPNNSGKSRILRALALVLGAVSADDDDVLDGAAPADLEVVIAPAPTEALDDDFGRRETQRLGGDLVQTIDDTQQLVERASWRLTLERPDGGGRVRSTFRVMTFDAGKAEWAAGTEALTAAAHNRNVVSADFVSTGRDIAEDLTRRGSTILRMLRDLRISDTRRAEIQSALADLGLEIAAESATIRDLTNSLQRLDGAVDFLGDARVHPLPTSVEELARSVSVEVDTGTGPMPVRFHGAGTRSLAAVQAHAAFRATQRSDPGELLPHVVTLLEEPEAHLHPQAQFDLPVLFGRLGSQVITSTHSSHLVTCIDPRTVRIIRRDKSSGTRVLDLKPVAEDEPSVDRARDPRLHASEMEKLRTLIERPFGELLFATAIVIGDGITERELVPPLARAALGPAAHGICAVNAGSLNGDYSIAIAKFANLLEIPWVALVDDDEAGRDAAAELVGICARGLTKRTIWLRVPDRPGESATERVILDFDREISLEVCARLGTSLDARSKDGEILKAQKKLKGSHGRLLAEVLLEKHPWKGNDPLSWPTPFRRLMEWLATHLGADLLKGEPDG